MRKWYPWLVVGTALVFTGIVYPRLPEQIATHWDVSGVVNGWSGRLAGAMLIPGIMVIMALLLPRLPAIDPRRVNYEKFRPTYDLIINAVLTMLAVLHIAMLGVALGWPVSMARLTPIMAGGLFVVLGNVLPRARPNWLVGIRTPWTLSNDRVWERTHRLGGFMFVAAGVALMLGAAAPTRLVGPLILGAVMVAAIVPLVYSYVAWKQETSR